MQFSIVALLFSLLMAFTSGLNPFDYHPVEEVKEVCKALSVQDDRKMEVDLYSPISYAEMIWLGVWNMKFDFGSKLNPKLKFSKIQWRLPIVDTLFNLFKETCPKEFVAHSFINTLHHLILIYYNSETKAKAPPESRWTNTLMTLERCINETKPLKLEGGALVIDNILLKDEPVAVLPPHEIADDNGSIDLIVDTFWWIFSFSFGTCYSPASYRSSWAPRYKKLFYEDFIVPLLIRWSSIEPLTDFGYIFGDHDLQSILINIRMCVTGAYLRLGIADRQLIRPYTFGMAPNFKTGEVAAK